MKSINFNCIECEKKKTTPKKNSCKEGKFPTWEQARPEFASFCAQKHPAPKSPLPSGFSAALARADQQKNTSGRTAIAEPCAQLTERAASERIGSLDCAGSFQPSVPKQRRQQQKQHSS